MPLIPYLHFKGTCAEAMRFYGSVFGTEPTLMYYRDAPEGPPEWKESDRVLHSQVATADGTLMASDFPPGEGDAQAAVSLMQGFTDMDAARACFEALSEGGDPIMPWGPTFFSKGFGMVRDRFGTHWMISADPDD